MNAALATNPEAPAVIQAPAPGAASSELRGENGQDGAQTPPAPIALSTASLTESIRKQLTGETTTPTPAAGAEPSPEAGQPTDTSTPPPAPTPPNTPPEDDDDDEEKKKIAAFPPEAVAALASQRKQKKELKAQLKATAEENAALKAQLAGQTSGQPPKPTEADPNADALPGTSPELDRAEATVREQQDLRNWTRKEARALEQAIKDGADTAPLLAALQAQVAAHQITLPGDPDAVLAWLTDVRTKAEDTLEVARGDVRFLRQQAEQHTAELRSEGETFAREFAPKIFEAGSEENKRFNLIKQAVPGIEKQPLGMRLVAAAVRGWDVIKGEIESRGATANQGKANGNGAAQQRPAGKPAAVLPTAPGARLPGAPAVVPARPAEGAESSSSIFKRYQAALADPQATEQEREKLKQEWVKAGIAGR